VNVPLLDLKAQYQSIKTEIDPVVAEIMESQYFILGPKVKECEEAVAAYSNCSHAIGVSSGTDALLIALMAEGIGAGDEVITTPYTFFATVGSIVRTGATPVFVDIDPVSFNIDPLAIEEKVTDMTKAIIPVHLYGQMADMDPIIEIARKNGIAVIEDGAQAIGAERNGQRAGSVGDYGCFSFFPSKNLGAFGDGGMVVTNDPERAERLEILRAHGSRPKYYHTVIGGNFRLDALQAAVVTVKLSHLDSWTAGRQSNAQRYDRLLGETGLVEKGLVSLPTVIANRHIFNQYVIRVDRRDELRDYLKENSIGCEIYYPVPLHIQECFSYLGLSKGDMPESEKAADTTLALPVYPELSDEQAKYVVDTIASFMS
jgi:dTDP-4-amino-4,6-dideoxygalactose transaminase